MMTPSDRRATNLKVRSLLSALEITNPGSRHRASRVAVYACATGAKLGLDLSELQDLRYAAELREYGTVMGLDALEVGGFSGRVLLWIEAAANLWNGAGDNTSRCGKDIPVGGRIILVAKVFDDATFPEKTSKETIADAQAVEHLTQSAGTLFDPGVVKAFLSVQPIIQPVGL